MKKALLFSLVMAWALTVLVAKTPPKPPDFSGNWVLDTSQSKKLPQGLESCTMNVSQSSQQLNVKTSIKGDLRPNASVPNGTNSPNGPNAGGGQGPGSAGPYPGSTPGNYPGGVGGGMGMPRVGGMGMPGGMGRGPMGEGMPGVGMPGTRGGVGRCPGGGKSQGIDAFRFYPSNAVYKLDGNESTAKLGGSGQSNATLRANWAKGGKELKLSMTGADDSDRRGSQLRLNDIWKLAKDGQILKVDRTVQTGRGSTSLHLVFHKEDTSSANSPAS